MCSHVGVSTVWGASTAGSPTLRRSWSGPVGLSTTRRRSFGQVFSNPSRETSDQIETTKGASSPVDAFLFRAAEALGIVVGDGATTSIREIHDRVPVRSVEEAVERIQHLYESSYFFSGEGRQADWDVFDDECEFVDGFSSFRGTGRFRRNVSNFGKVLVDPVCTLVTLKVVERDETCVSLVASWVFRARVQWIGGLLAASGETTYVLQKSSDGLEWRVIRHEEVWKTSKSTVLRNMLFNTKQ